MQNKNMIYGNRKRIQVLTAQQRTNLADVNSKEARTSSDSYYLDSLNIILHELKNGKNDIFTKDFAMLSDGQDFDVAKNEGKVFLFA